MFKEIVGFERLTDATLCCLEADFRSAVLIEKHLDQIQTRRIVLEAVELKICIYVVGDLGPVVVSIAPYELVKTRSRLSGGKDPKGSEVFGTQRGKGSGSWCVIGFR